MTVRDRIRVGEDRAVSPVIGVLLMVTITVVLAAVIGTFMLGFDDQLQETAPNAQVTITDVNVTEDETVDNVTFAHSSGDRFTNDNTEGLRVTVGGEQLGNVTNVDFSSGDEITIPGGETDNEAGEAGDTVRVIWVGQDSSNVLAERQA